MAAHEQGKFWPYHDEIFANAQKLNEAFFTDTAKKLRLDLEQFQRSRNDLKLRAQVQEDMKLGNEVGIRGTPTVFINGRLLKQKDPRGFKAAIDGLLKKQ